MAEPSLNTQLPAPESNSHSSYSISGAPDTAVSDEIDRPPTSNTQLSIPDSSIPNTGDPTTTEPNIGAPEITHGNEENRASTIIPGRDPGTEGGPTSEEEDLPPDPDYDDALSEGQIWTAKEKQVLQEELLNYRATERTKKAKYIATTQIFTWFGNHGGTGRHIHIPGFNLKVTFDSVVKEKKKSEILAEAKRLAGGYEESKKWLPYYSIAKQTVRQELTEAERIEIELEVARQRAEGVPRAKQAENSRRYGKRILRSMDRLRFKSMRMRTLGFECHYSTNGKMTYSVYDTHILQAESSNIPSFGQFNPKALKEFTKCWVQYIKHVATLETGTARPQAKTTFSAADLKLSTTGLPLVPDRVPNVKGLELAPTQQAIIRAYCRKHYEIGRGRDGPIPYSHMVPEWQDYIAPTDMPTNVTWKEPSRYSANESHLILKLWRGRQEKGEIPFRFQSVMDSNKIPTPTEYPANIFQGLKEPSHSSRPSNNGLQQTIDDDASEPPSSEEDVITEKPRAKQKRATVAEGRDNPGLGFELASSPTVQDTSPVKRTVTTKKKKGDYPTPGQSAASTPMPNEDLNLRKLRSQTKATTEVTPIRKKKGGKK